MLICEHAEINQAKNILSLANLKQHFRQKYYDRQDRLLEKNSWEAYGKKIKLENALNFLRMGLSIEQVAQGTGLPIDEVKMLQIK